MIIRIKLLVLKDYLERSIAMVGEHAHITQSTFDPFWTPHPYV